MIFYFADSQVNEVNDESISMVVENTHNNKPGEFVNVIHI